MPGRAGGVRTTVGVKRGSFVEVGVKEGGVVGGGSVEIMDVVVGWAVVEAPQAVRITARIRFRN